MLADILESAMLAAFGLAWPVNILNTLRNKSTTGKSLPFLLIILTGYVFGLSAKLMRGNINYVAVFYTVNLLLVLADTLLYFHYRRLERQAISPGP
ncbi:MAG: hypothetical protein FWG97_04385 [Deltaproteobacteria bacterium]|nr:hypothetical protein [Deltaproteobacteria bacterium]